MHHYLGALSRWRTERVQLSKHAAASSALAGVRLCERVVVFSKSDLVPEWGIEVCMPFAFHSDRSLCHAC